MRVVPFCSVDWGFSHNDGEVADRGGIEPPRGQVNSLLPYQLGYRSILKVVATPENRTPFREDMSLPEI